MGTVCGGCSLGSLGQGPQEQHFHKVPQWPCDMMAATVFLLGAKKARKAQRPLATGLWSPSMGSAESFLECVEVV